MKNIVHTLTLAQMRANPRRTLVTLVGVNQSFYQLLRVECLEGNLPSTENELAISQTLAKKTGWKIGDQVSLDLLRVWTPQGVDSAGEMIYRQTSGPGIMGLSDSYMLRSVGEKQFTITAIVDPGGFDDQNVFAWEPCFTVLEDQIPPDGLWCAYYTVSSLGREPAALALLWHRLSGQPSIACLLRFDGGNTSHYSGGCCVSGSKRLCHQYDGAHTNAGNVGQCGGYPGAEAAVRLV